MTNAMAIPAIAIRHNPIRHNPVRHNPNSMTAAPLLITSFQPWRAHQLSNTSDDLIAALQQRNQLPTNSFWVRNVPVNFETASIPVLNAIQQWRPHTVVCCGMAEKRAQLSLEKFARQGGRTLETGLSLQSLLLGTQLSEVSFDAGAYVCNHLYYQILNALQTKKLKTQALFIHVPMLTPENRRWIAEDFAAICFRLQEMYRSKIV
ncbi:MAG: peptidase C15 [Cyanobacteria bacterium J06554_3]